MPQYAYECDCGWKALEFYKSLPKDPNAPITCRECGGSAKRNMADDAGSSIMMGNAKSFGFDKIAALPKDSRGNAYYRDANGQRREVRTVRDVEKFVRGDNNIGRPRMIERVNKVTGQTEYVPQRREDGSIVRESEKLVPLPKERIPAKYRDGVNKNGVRDRRAIDPAKLWGDDGKDMPDGGYTGFLRKK